MNKEYHIIELLRPQDFTELPTGGMAVNANPVYIAKMLNDLAKEGWRLVWSLPDNSGTAIMERDVKDEPKPSAMDLATMAFFDKSKQILADIAADLKLASKKRWW